MTTNILIKKLYEDVVLPEIVHFVFDIRIHSFHKINKYDGVIPYDTETFALTQDRVLIKTGISIKISDPRFIIQIISRNQTTIKDGLVVLGHQFYSGQEKKELEVILHNASDELILLKRGYRIAQGILVPRYEMNMIYE